MARKNNLIELTLEVKRKGTDQIGKYRKELTDLKKTTDQLNLALNKTKKQLSAQNTDNSVKKLGADSQKTQAQINKLETALEKVSEELKQQKKLESDLRKEANGRVKNARQQAAASRKVYQDKIKGLKNEQAAQKKTNKETKESVTNLRGLGNAVATVNGPLNDYSGRINSLAQGFKTFNPLIIGTVTAVAALSFALPGATRAFANMEKQLFRIDALLKQTGNSSGFVKNQLESMAQELAMNTLTSLTQSRDAIGLLLSFPNIRTENFEKVLQLSQDVAEVTGRDLKSSAEQIAKAVTDPIKGISKLTEVGVVFTKEQESLIKSTQAMNGTFAAQGVILDVLESQYGGAARAAAQGLAGTFDTIGQRLENIQIKLGELVNRTGAIQYVGDLAHAFENLVTGIYQADDAVQLVDSIIIAIKTAGEDQSQLVTEQLRLQNALKQSNKELGESAEEVGKSFQSNMLSIQFNDIVKNIRSDIDQYDDVQEETISRIKYWKEELNKEIQEQKKENNNFIAAAVNDNLSEQVKALAISGQISESELDQILESGVLDSNFIREKIENAVKSGADLTGQGDVYSLLRTILGDYIEDDYILRKVLTQNIQESFSEQTKIAINSTQELVKLSEKKTDAIKASAKKEKAEVIKQEEEKQDQLRQLKNQQTFDRLKIETKAAQEANKQELQIERRKLRKDSDNVEIQNKIAELEAGNNIFQLQTRTFELLEKQLKIEEKISKIRGEFTTEDKNGEKVTSTDEEIAIQSPDFQGYINELKNVQSEIDFTNKKVENINDNLSSEQKFNEEVNQKKINDQINTVLEDTSIKQNELTSKLLGNTEQSLDNQLQAIDTKYDKVLNNLEERIGEIPDNVATQLAKQKSLEKATIEFDNINKRAKELKKEFSEGEISADSFSISINELNKNLQGISKKTTVEVELINTDDDYTEAAEKGMKRLQEEIDFTLSKVEESGFSEGLTLKQEAFDKLDEYRKEVERIKALDPNADVSKQETQISRYEDIIGQTYDSTTKIITERSEKFANGFIKNVFSALEKGESVSFGDAALMAAYEVSTSMLQDSIKRGVEQLTTGGGMDVLSSIGSFFSSLGESIWSGMSSFFSMFGDAVTSVFNGIKDIISEIDLTPVFDVMKEVFNAVFDGIKAFMSGGEGGGGGGEGAGIGSILGSIAGSFFHDGGIVGEKTGNRRLVSASAFKNPKYFHDGGGVGTNLKPDEVAAVLQKGEMVLDKKTTKDLAKEKSGANGGQGGGQQIVNVVGGDEIANAVSGNGKFNDVVINTIKNNRSQINEYFNR